MKYRAMSSPSHSILFLVAKLVILVYSNDNQRKTILPGCNVIIVYFRYVIVFQSKSRYITK